MFTATLKVKESPKSCQKWLSFAEVVIWWCSLVDQMGWASLTILPSNSVYTAIIYIFKSSITHFFGERSEKIQQEMVILWSGIVLLCDTPSIR
jgi:hypothetical protein